MFNLKRKRDSYRFSDKVHPIQGIASVGIAVLLLIGMIFLFLLSSKHPGILIIGLAGIFIFFGSIAGEVLAIMGIRREDIHYRFPIMGILMNGFIIIICVALYVAGLTIGGV